MNSKHEYHNTGKMNSQSRDHERPNIIYIFTDQQWAGAMSCAGNHDMATPAMDNLAASGIRFERAYCTCPVCSPSRASMFSGLMPHHHGVIKNDTRIVQEHVDTCLEHVLGARGYKCAYAGKWHISAYNGITDEELKQHPYQLLAKWDGSDPIATVTDACVNFLAAEHDQPFFLVASYDSPHEICGWRDREKGIQPQATDKCPALPGNFDISETEASILREVYLDRHPEQKRLTPESWQRYRWAYYRYIERADKAVGKLLTALEANGLRENTLVIFSSDHGDGMGAHQWLGKCCHYDEVMRVPFIMSLPAEIAQGQVDRTRLISSGQDFYATVLDYAGALIPGKCEGMSLRGHHGPAAIGWRDQVVSEIWVAGPGNTWAGNPFGRMLCTDRYKYVVYERGEHREQLFDMQNDPLENVSLVEDKAAQSVIADHRKRLLAWCRKTNDEVGMAMVAELVPE